MKKTAEKKERKKLTKKQVIAIVTVIVTILLTAFWVTFAYITLNKTDSNGYEIGKGTRYIAHRGYSDLYYQNTKEAFSAAAEEDFFQGIETDVWMTKDGVFVCCHDEDPFADKSVKVTEKTYDEIKDLPLDMAKAEKADQTLPYRIATLSEYLDIVSASHKYAFVEIKQKFSEEEIRTLVDLCYAKNGRSRTYFCSFLKKQIDYVQKYEPLARTEMFATLLTTAFVYSAAGYNVGFHVRYLATDAFVKMLHKRGSFCCAWTVTDKATAERLTSYGVDWITVNGRLV